MPTEPIAERLKAATTTLKAFKGFDRDLQCRGHQFEVGQEYRIEGGAKLCHNGFHACTNPIDILEYYPPATSRYCEVEMLGVSDETHEADSKRVAAGVRVIRELTVREFLQACYDHHSVLGCEKQASGCRGHAQASGYSGHAQASGDRGHAQASGDRGHAQASGDMGHAQASGDRGHAQASGDSGHAQASGYSGHAQASGQHSIACSLGCYGCATASGGCDYIVLAEYNERYHLLDVRVGKVGREIERGKAYCLKNGEFVEVVL